MVACDTCRGCGEQDHWGPCATCGGSGLLTCACGNCDDGAVIVGGEVVRDLGQPVGYEPVYAVCRNAVAPSASDVAAYHAAAMGWPAPDLDTWAA